MEAPARGCVVASSFFVAGKLTRSLNGQDISCGCRRHEMATYISTVKFTARGFKAIRDTTKRAAAVKAAASKSGIKVKDIYWTMGTYDGLMIYEAPDDETATALLLKLASE